MLQPVCVLVVAETVRIVGGLLAAAAVLSVTVQSGAAAEGARKPNVIVILADDLGYADVGFQGCKDIPTPNLDALAKAGVRCTDGYVTCSVCVPSRSGLLTGRYQQRFGQELNGGNGLPAEEKMVGDLFKTGGYATGVIGKWHLGAEAPFHPLARGFDEFYGFLGGASSFLPLQEGETVTVKQDEMLIPIRSGPLFRGRTRVDDPEYLTDAFGREAVAFIERHKQQPFFLYLAFNAVHVPLQATEKYLSRFPEITNKDRRTYAAMVSAMDDAVGLVTAKLKAENLEPDTLVFFLSDNGGHPIANAARNDPLRGEKSTIFEGGIRVPFVVKWTEKIPAGRTYSHPVISLDIASTALAVAGIEPPSGLHLDGVNLVPYLAGQLDQAPHDALYWRYGYHRAIRRGKWKVTMPVREQAGLYDVTSDIGESKDLWMDYPEIVLELLSLYEHWDAKLLPPRSPDVFMKDAPRAVPRRTGLPAVGK